MAQGVSYMDEEREFTLSELSRFNGKDGQPAYIAFAGKVYDVSNSPLWKTGTHLNRHAAGADLTDQLGSAPHGTNVLAREGVKVVGTLKVDTPRKDIPGFLAALFRRFPALRKHTHPPTVHFPIAFMSAATLFTAIHLAVPDLPGIDSEKLAFIMLILGTVFTPLTVATGFFTWWINYQFRWSYRVRNLIFLSAALFAAQVICIVIRLSGPVPQGVSGLVYYGLMLLMAPLVMLLGYNGGQLVFPTHVEY